MKTAAKFISIAAILGLCIGATAYAQALQKYVMPDGRVVYSDKPVPGGKLVGEIAPPPPVDPAARAKAEEAARRDREAAKASSTRVEERRAQRKTVQQLQAELDEAKRNLEQGVEPLPGERTGTAGGASRLNDAYWARQQANKKKVEAAQRALDEALAQRR